MGKSCLTVSFFRYWDNMTSHLIVCFVPTNDPTKDCEMRLASELFSFQKWQMDNEIKTSVGPVAAPRVICRAFLVRYEFLCST